MALAMFLPNSMSSNSRSVGARCVKVPLGARYSLSKNVESTSRILGLKLISDGGKNGVGLAVADGVEDFLEFLIENDVFLEEIIGINLACHDHFTDPLRAKTQKLLIHRL